MELYFVDNLLSAKTDNVVVDFHYDEIRGFSDEINGFINTLGNVVADFQFDEVKDFSYSYAALGSCPIWAFIDFS